MHTSIPACQTDNSIRFKWGLLNVTWWSFVGRNQEQLDAFGAFAAEGTAQIEVITVAWLMKPRLRFLQVLQLGNGKMKLFVTWCDLRSAILRLTSMKTFRREVQATALTGRWRCWSKALSCPIPIEQGPVDVIRLHAKKHSRLISVEISRYRMEIYRIIYDYII